MSYSVSSHTMAASSIRALIIQPDNTYEVREITNSMRELVGGKYAEPYVTDHCILWGDEHSKTKSLPMNELATCLWWNLDPGMEGVDVLQGPVLVTGLANEAMDSGPVSDAVIDLFERMERIYRETEGRA
ncbi:hypothetical protein A5690_24740 [Mycobacterium intracellulare]|uniref:DUF3846 domain-containing protein n=1 Tax=Mycobacterium intracellulare TaxID=1767 RepID=UPI0007E9E9BA|nr:DUF3846 domain-containing protein [Mycobacterium intracellulare]OBH40531.1 hypothetical protein A5690_24740 [Mycobacterium intracellulare]